MTDKEELFCLEYIKNPVPMIAARSAGYAKSTAKYAYEWITETLLNSTSKRHLPYKPHLVEFINDKLNKIKSAKIADATEVMEYLTSVMRGESKSEVVVTEFCGDGFSEAKRISKSPDEKERLKAAELIGKRHGLFKDNVDLKADSNINITIDYGDENES